MVRSESVRTLIALAAKHKLQLHQLDVATTFLNGELKEEIYMKQPEQFELKRKEHLVCKLKRSIYSLKQSSRCWNKALGKHLKKMGFKQSKNDPCIYMLNTGGEIFIISVYVEDIILAGKTSERIQKFINAIAERYDITDMGKLHHFVGMKINYLNSGDIWIGQPAYVRKVLKKFAGFSDADWAGDHDDRKSTTGFVFMMSGAAISWNSKKRTCVDLLTAEVEYIALGKAAQGSI